ncbi:hypothetical protein ACF0H5_020479 [Mactra antiquata]
MMEDEPFRRYSLQEYPGRSYVLQHVNPPGSPVLPVRRRGTVPPPAQPCNVQYEYVPTSPADGVIRKYSLEEYQVEPTETYIRGQSLQSFIPVMSVQSTMNNMAFRPVQQVQPYYSVVKTVGNPTSSPTSPPRHGSHGYQQTSPGQGQGHILQQQPQPSPCQHPMQQIQYVRPVQQLQQMQPTVEYVEVPTQMSPTMTSFIPVNYQPHPDYHRELSNIREDKTVDMHGDVFVESPIKSTAAVPEERNKMEATLDDVPEYEPLKRVSSRKKIVSISKEAPPKEEHSKEVSHKEVQEHSKSVSMPRRRHTVHDAPPKIEQKSRRNSMCPMTAYNLR